tara:strand:- start:223 stop:486 length:264 start_codon:yes stop_codon:yes gene_type:complete
MGNDGFVIPKTTINQLNEFSNGGFILFYFNEDGYPEVYTKYDNPMHAMALQYYVEHWAAAIETANLDASVDAIKEDDNEEENGEDFI